MTQEEELDLNKRIIVIDDVPSARRIVRKMLEKIGFKDVVEVADSTQALGLIKETKTDLIISDWNMPGMAGIDLVRLVKADPELSSIPFVMITSSSDKEAVVEAYDSGVHDYMLKPFGFETLLEKVKSALAKV